jgi:hypothetical protein
MGNFLRGVYTCNIARNFVCSYSEFPQTTLHRVTALLGGACSAPGVILAIVVARVGVRAVRINAVMWRRFYLAYDLTMPEYVSH